MALTALEALREIQAQLAGAGDVIPEGWKTDMDWSRETGLARCTVHATLTQAVNAGLMERKRFRLRSDAGVRAVWHYRQTDMPAAAKKKRK